MIPELGHFALLLALALAAVQSSLPLIGAQRGNATWMAVARPAAQGQFLMIVVAFACLTQAFVVSDFSVLNVARNSHTAKPLLYKISGVWGNHEGSLLLWVLILSIFGAALATFGRNLPPSLRARALAVHGMIGLAFLSFMALTSNPFERLDPAPANGSGLNALLQDPGLAFHPPFLYLGYVGFSMAFSLAVAALIEGRVDAAWARWVRPWTLAAWGCLTVGIALGSWWAYYELGWGGWWFWDPVENASFMPWLVGTALLHSAIVVEKREALKSWTILLAILTFSLSLIGTFLVRSGVLTSVHTFATDPARGLFILLILLVAIGGPLTLYAVRAPALKGSGLFRPVSREGAMVLNNLLLSVAAAAILVGTVYPIIVKAFGGVLSVGADYFNLMFTVLMAPMILAMALGPMLAWKRGDLAGVLARLKVAIGGAVATILVALYLTRGADILAVFGMALAAWVFGGVVAEFAERTKLFRAPMGEFWRRARHLPRSAYGMSIAHTGVAIAIAGITASSAWQSEKIQFMRPGDTVAVAGYRFKFSGVETVRGPNYVARRGRFEVSRDGRAVATLTPEKRFYPVEKSSTTEAAIHTTWLSDLYVVLGDPNGKGGWATKLFHNPLVPWIWVGAIIMFVGGGVSLTDRRHRVGAPRRSGARGAAAGKPAAARA